MTVDLTPSWKIGSLDLTSYPYSVDASSTVEIGEPEMVVESVRSLLADGDLERTVRHGNRQYVLPVYVEGETLAELARAEADLRSAITGTGLLLTHDAGDGFSPASVYEVQTARLTPERDDTFESHLIRKFAVTLTCGPFARSAQATTITALAPPPVTPITASVTTADTTTGFTAYAAATYPGGVQSGSIPVSDQGDNARATVLGGQPEMTVTYTPAAPFATSTTPYLVIEASGDYPGSFSINGKITGIALSRATSLGTTIYVLYTGEVVVSSISIYRKSTDGTANVPARLTINIHDIYRTNTMPQITGRQTAAVIDIGGTERTPCSLQVNPAAGEQMGTGIVHTCPEEGIGYSPALRQRRISGNTVTAGGTLMSGAVEGVTSNPVIATVPVRSLPEDGYSLVALLRSSVVGTFPITYNVRTAFSGNYIGSSGGPRIASATFTAANTWTLVPLGNLTLPPVRASQEAFVQFDLYRTTVGAEVIELDEWWAFRMGEDCALTMVQSPRSYLWLDSPDVTSPVPRVWVGNNADRTDAHHPAFWLINQGNHVLHPNGTSIFVATNGIANPTVTATAYRRWHSNAAS